MPISPRRISQQRLGIHRFETLETERLRLTVYETGGDPSARVFEIRAYHKEASS
jgi:hypothetical protein